MTGGHDTARSIIFCGYHTVNYKYNKEEQDEKESEIKKTNEKITPVKKVQKQNVQTGDESNGALWFTFMGLALLLIFLLVIKYIKGKRD